MALLGPNIQGFFAQTMAFNLHFDMAIQAMTSAILVNPKANASHLFTAAQNNRISLEYLIKTQIMALKLLMDTHSVDNEDRTMVFVPIIMTLYLTSEEEAVVGLAEKGPGITRALLNEPKVQLN